MYKSTQDLGKFFTVMQFCLEISKLDNFF